MNKAYTAKEVIHLYGNHTVGCSQRDYRHIIILMKHCSKSLKQYEKLSRHYYDVYEEGMTFSQLFKNIKAFVKNLKTL